LHGRRKFDPASRDDPVNVYACVESAHHLSKGWEVDMENDELALTHWLGDVPQDALVVSAGQVLGVETLRKLSRTAERDGKLWLAGRYWAVVSKLMVRLGGTGISAEEASHSLDAIATFLQSGPGSASPELRDHADEVQLHMMTTIAIAIDIPKMIARRAVVEQVLTTEAAAREPQSAMTVRMVSFCVPLMSQGDSAGYGKEMYAGLMAYRSAAHTNPDPATRSKCLMLSFGFLHCIDTFLLVDNFEWDTLCGENGSALIQAAQAFDYETDTRYFGENTNGDWLNMAPGSVHALLVHYGDMKSALENADRSLGYVRRAVVSTHNIPSP
jgi:hypothetical protein